MRALLIGLAAFTVACGSAPEAAKKAEETKAPAPAPKKVADHTSMLLDKNRTGVSIVPDHLVGNSALPGGSLGEYDLGGKDYEMFVAELATAQDAAFLLPDVKKTLTDPEYLPQMGGYFGTFSGKPFYVFAKGQYVAGVYGLPQKPADELARELAVRLR